MESVVDLTLGEGRRMEKYGTWIARIIREK
jgi:hypothetical protein